MILAEIDSTPYNIMLLVHIVAIVVGFAPAWLTPVLVRLTAQGDRGAADALEMSILRLSLPALALAGIIGFGLAGMSDDVFKMSQTWLMVSILLWLILLAVVLFVTRPGIKRFAAGDAGARGIVMAGTGVTHLILVVIVALMIWKPGAPF